MTNKQTNPEKTCCTQKNKTYFLIAIIIVIVLFVIFFPKEKQKKLVDAPIIEVVEIISDSVEVTSPDKIDIEIIPVSEPEKEVIKIDVDAETEIEREIIPIITLNKNNTFTAPKITDSETLVKTFLEKYNQKEFIDACEILADTKCDATINGSVARFGQEFEKMDNGYENISISKADAPDFHSDVICVEYDYRYTSSSNTNPVHEVMSFYVQDEKITYRICEDKTREGSTLECPIQARRNFCL
jgi:hypothetical protein